MMRKLLILLTLVGFGMTACGDDSGTDSPDTLSKSEAAALDGKSDGRDVCEWLDWYGDGVCDDFCPKPDPDCATACISDSDCPDGYCEDTSSCAPGAICPAVVTAECVVADCDDTSTPNPLCDIRELCADGEISARQNGCFVCVDARTCAPTVTPSCDDASTPNPLCDIREICADGEVSARQNGCFVCVDAVTCEPTVTPSCDDGSAVSPFCDIREVCEAGLESVVKNGCFECVDPTTCEPPSTGDQLCGGIAGLICPEGSHCKMPDGMCMVADGAGTCQPDFDACPAVFAPVCGCNGQTYSNACAAELAGAAVDHGGDCNTQTGDTCGGFAGLTCDNGQFCQFEATANCGRADQTGTCATKPEACIALYDPVCGCDGNTYSNDCQAAAAGASVSSEGACN